jgi:hypothetical protein
MPEIILSRAKTTSMLKQRRSAHDTTESLSESALGAGLIGSYDESVQLHFKVLNVRRLKTRTMTVYFR